MIRTITAALIAAIVIAVPGAAVTAQTKNYEAALIAKAEKIHKDVITLDTHVDINTSNFTEAVNYSQFP